MNRRHFLCTFLIGLGAAPLVAKALAASALIDPPEIAPTHKVGPVQEADYVDVKWIEHPAEEVEARCTRHDGTIDLFRLRPARHDEPQSPGSKTMVSRLVWTNCSRVVKGREIELASFQLAINIPHSDFNDGSMLSRIDEIAIEPPDITGSWQEVIQS